MFEEFKQDGIEADNYGIFESKLGSDKLLKVIFRSMDFKRIISSPSKCISQNDFR